MLSLSNPHACNVKVIDASTLSAEALAIRLAAEAVVPVLVRHWTWAESSSLDHLLAQHGSVVVKVARGGVRWDKFWLMDTYQLPLSEYAQRVRSGNVTSDEYVFEGVGNTSIGTDETYSALGDIFARLSCHHNHEFCRVGLAARGTMNLIYGSGSSGIGFHSHGIAINALIEGEKQWWFPPPEWDLGAVEGVRVPALLAHEEEAELRRFWRCNQRPGDLMWIPGGRVHGVINRGETVALARQIPRNGGSLLHQAAFEGLAEEVRAAIKSTGAVATRTLLHANVGDHAGYTPLHDAAAQGHSAVIRVLVEGGATVDAKLTDGSSALHLASLKGKPEAVRALLECGAPAGARDDEGRSALHMTAAPSLVATEGHTGAVLALLQAGAQLEARDDDGATPLHYSARYGSTAVARLLLKMGAYVDATCAEGETALVGAARSGNSEMLQALIDFGASVNARNHDGVTALHVAAYMGHAAPARVLLEGGADVSATDGEGRSALMAAAYQGHLDVAQVLIQAGHELAAVHASGLTALQHATQSGANAEVAELIRRAVSQGGT